MTPFVFDTLSASKQLREAGMSEGVAEAVVSVFQHAAAMPDISHLATKADVADMATKADLAAFRAEMAAEFKMVRLEIQASADVVRAEINDKFRQQTWAVIGGVAVMLTIATTAGRLFG